MAKAPEISERKLEIIRQAIISQCRSSIVAAKKPKTLKGLLNVISNYMTDDLDQLDAYLDEKLLGKDLVKQIYAYAETTGDWD
jgi:hypothetical protein